MNYNKESIYDEKIAPLMKEIIDICKQEDLSFAAQFYLKEHYSEEVSEPMYCTTVIHIDDQSKGSEQIKFIAGHMKYGIEGKPFVMAMTVSRSAEESNEKD